MSLLSHHSFSEEQHSAQRAAISKFTGWTGFSVQLRLEKVPQGRPFDSLRRPWGRCATTEKVRSGRLLSTERVQLGRLVAPVRMPEWKLAWLCCVFPCDSFEQWPAFRSPPDVVNPQPIGEEMELMFVVHLPLFIWICFPCYVTHRSLKSLDGTASVFTHMCQSGAVSYRGFIRESCFCSASMLFTSIYTRSKMRSIGDIFRTPVTGSTQISPGALEMPVSEIGRTRDIFHIFTR